MRLPHKFENRIENLSSSEKKNIEWVCLPPDTETCKRC